MVMMKNVMVGNVGGTEVVGINDNGVGSVVCKLEDVPDIVENHDRLVNLETDRKNAISKMSKSWQHNADDNDDLLTRFVEMANRQFEERDRLRELLSSMNEMSLLMSHEIYEGTLLHSQVKQLLNEGTK